MKKSAIVFLVFFLCYLITEGQTSFSGISETFVTDSKPPELTIISPNGGETCFITDSLKVEFYAYDDSFGDNPINLSLSIDSGYTFTVVAQNLPNTDSARIMPLEELTDEALIKIFAEDEFGIDAEDESDFVFTFHGVYIDLKAYLQGPFNTSGMTTLLNDQGYLPISQPYGLPPWNYYGTEAADPLPNSNVVDWVLVEIREAPDAASANDATTIARGAGLLLNTGNITGLDGSNNMLMGFEINDNLFAVIYHRNHLAVKSAFPLVENSGTYSYDFSTGADRAYGGAIAHSQLAAGIWGLTGGDVDADSEIDNVDKNDVWLPGINQTGYKAADINMDGIIDEDDLTDLWKFNSGRGELIDY